MSKDNILKEGKYECTGCGICVKKCPTNAISIQKDEDGHLKAVVEKDKCVECGQCITVCQKFRKEDPSRKIDLARAYYGYSNDEKVLKMSTSGGVVYEICKEFLKKKYKIIGVTYDCQKNIAKHIIIDTLEELPLITGSKYIQSYTQEAIEQIDPKEKYVYIGTPCQVFGMRQYIKEKGIEENFLLIDFFCHGHGGYLLWEKYVDYINQVVGIKQIERVEFRSKEKGWHQYLMKVSGKEKTYAAADKEDPFQILFLSDATIMDGCYTCGYRFHEVYSDIRVADFWGRDFADNDTGVSMILGCTDMGNEVIESMSDIITVKEIPFSKIYEAKAGHKKGLKTPPKFREQVMEQLKEEVKLEDITKFVKKQMRVKILLDDIAKWVNKNLRRKN